MTEPVKRYAMHYAEVNGDDGLYPDPTGEWCRYQPRFDAPQLSREELRLLDQALGVVLQYTRFNWVDDLQILIARLRAAPSPPSPRAYVDRPEPPGKP